jgi:peroxiredoxin
MPTLHHVDDAASSTGRAGIETMPGRHFAGGRITPFWCRSRETAMTLTERLDAIRRDVHRQFTPDVRSAFGRFVDGLVAADVAGGALAVGARMPAFALPGVGGRIVRSRDLLAGGPLVVSFFRGDWCPYCTAELEALQAALPRIAAAGARLVAITPDTAGLPRRAARRLRLGYEVLSDVDLGVGATFGLVFRVPDEMVRILSSFGLDIPARHGIGGWLLPIPATYVVDGDGTIVAATVDPDFTRRMDPDEVLTVLERLRDVSSGTTR